MSEPNRPGTRDFIIQPPPLDRAGRGLERPEPRIDPKRAVGSTEAFVRMVRRGLGRLMESREPHFDPDRAVDAPDSLLIHPVLSVGSKRGSRRLLVFIIVSLLIHVALLLGLGFNLYGFGDGEEGQPIPVRLVLEQPQPDQPRPQPPKPKEPEPQKKQEEQKPQPHGPLASDELGDPKATGKQPTATPEPAAGAPQEKAGEAPPPPSEAQATPQQEAPATPSKLPPDPFHSHNLEQSLPETKEQTAAAGSAAPPPVPAQTENTEAAKPTRKPSPMRLAAVNPGGARRPNDHPDEPDHGEGHKAKYPGPDASYDEYLAYIRDLTRAHLVQSVPAELTRDRTGVAVFQVMVRPSGDIVWFSLVHPSGFQDADRVILAALDSIQKFPPLPQRMLNPDGLPVTWTLTLPLNKIDDP